ncbi:hypothetical protein D3C81_1803000 [compost metagenome]
MSRIAFLGNRALLVLIDKSGFDEVNAVCCQHVMLVRIASLRRVTFGNFCPGVILRIGKLWYCLGRQCDHGIECVTQGIVAAAIFGDLGHQIDRAASSGLGMDIEFFPDLGGVGIALM